MKKSLIAVLVAVVIVVLLAFSSLYVVDERQKALVLQFGRVVDVRENPGLYVKIPFIQDVVRYDDRILSRDMDPLEVTPLDDRRLVVDAFARYRIDDVRRFREANGTGGMAGAENRLDSILRSQVREVLGSVSSDEILSADRVKLMDRIREGAYNEAKSLGIEVIDVRLKRTDLPSENLDATFARMRAEREREAADEIARGNERAQEIRAEADRKKVETESSARRASEIIRGQADAKRAAILAEAYGQDPEFFRFYRSLDAYKTALEGSRSTMVLSPEGDFFSYLKNDNPTDAKPAPYDPNAPVPTFGSTKIEGLSDEATPTDATGASGASLMPADTATTDGTTATVPYAGTDGAAGSTADSTTGDTAPATSGQ